MSTDLPTTLTSPSSPVYVGDGLNHWPAFHYLDTAAAYRLALEMSSRDSTFYIVAEEEIKMKNIAEIIGKRLGLLVESKSMEEAQEHFDPLFGQLIGVDNDTSNKKTREVLGWNP